MDPVDDLIAKIPPHVLGYIETIGSIVTVLVITYVTMVGV